MDIKDPVLFHDYKGIIEGKKVKKNNKYYKDIKGIYKSEDPALSDNEIMYEVYSCEEDESYLGSVNWGLTIIHPILVNGEFNMTRGHFHMDLKCNEFYYGAAGEGLLLLMDEAGNTSAESIYEGSLHNIKGTYAHRLVAIGNMPLKVIASWSSEAGHDYNRIEKFPFKKRVFFKNGKVKIEDF